MKQIFQNGWRRRRLWLRKAIPKTARCSSSRSKIISYKIQTFENLIKSQKNPLQIYMCVISSWPLHDLTRFFKVWICKALCFYMRKKSVFFLAVNKIRNTPYLSNFLNDLNLSGQVGGRHRIRLKHSTRPASPIYSRIWPSHQRMGSRTFRVSFHLLMFYSVILVMEILLLVWSK